MSLLFPQLRFDGILVPRYIGTSATASEQEDFIQINPLTDHWRKKKKKCVYACGGWQGLSFLITSANLGNQSYTIFA